MKQKSIFIGKIKQEVLLTAGLFVFLFSSCSPGASKTAENQDCYVAAYVWPSCHDEQMSRDALWGEGMGEWEIIRKGTPRFEGHYQPRVPLWGYQMDDDPKAWEIKIEAATDHGVNTLIFDWYWYDGKPYLEEAVNEGFLKAANNEKMNFYLMWANHDVPGTMWNPYRYKTDSLIWVGEVDWENYKIVVDRVIKQYFSKPNYLKFNGEPVFSIYSFNDFIQSFNGLEESRKAVEYLRDEVKKAGFPGLHLQLVGSDANGNPNLLRPQFAEGKSISEIVSFFNINSITMYNMAGGSARASGDYIRYGVSAMKLREKWDSVLQIPFFPCVSVGWDNTPRYLDMGKEKIIYFNNTPYSFATFLQKARNYVNEHPEQPRFLVINAWNEWVEGSYLEPDMLWGFGYLEAVKKVMSGQYDKYFKK